MVDVIRSMLLGWLEGLPEKIFGVLPEAAAPGSSYGPRDYIGQAEPDLSHGEAESPDVVEAIDVDTLDYDPTPPTVESTPYDDPGYIAEQEARDAEFDHLLSAWEAEHEGPDIVQSLDEWKADMAADDEPEASYDEEFEL